MGIFSRRRRLSEATDQQLVDTGALGAYGQYGQDPIDGDFGFAPMGSSLRQVPYWTLEKARAFSVAAYRSNPMARAILDTYTSFAVGDSGLTLSCTNDDVRVVAEEFWNDPANHLAEQDIALRSHLIYGESAYEMMVGDVSGVVRRSVVDPTRITNVEYHKGNPLWPGRVFVRMAGAPLDQLGNMSPGNAVPFDVVRVDDFTQLRTGDIMFWRSFRALETDMRGEPFLGPVLDWLDNYDQVMSNLIDRTAVSRYLAMHMKIGGVQANGEPYDQAAIDAYVAQRGGNHVPRAGSMEVTNDRVEIEPLNIQSGSFEDTNTAGTLLTSVAAGTGLSKHWLAEPDQANRATSQSMAEPVRRRVGGVQNLWLGYQTEMLRFAVDRAVAAGRLPAYVPVKSAGDGGDTMVAASQTVSITGPEVAAADAKMVSEVMWNVAQSLTQMVAVGALGKEAAQQAAQATWEQLTGRPFPQNLADADPVDLAGTAGDAGMGDTNPMHKLAAV